MAADEAQSETQEDSLPEATIEPFLDMRDPTFRRILRAATSKFNQMICPLMASVCVRDLCMFWNDHSKSCYIVDTLKTNLYHTICPKWARRTFNSPPVRDVQGRRRVSDAKPATMNGAQYTNQLLAHNRLIHQFLFLLLFQPRLDSFQPEKVLSGSLL